MKTPFLIFLISFIYYTNMLYSANKEMMNILILEWTNTFLRKLEIICEHILTFYLLRIIQAITFFFPSQYVYPS